MRRLRPVAKIGGRSISAAIVVAALWTSMPPVCAAQVRLCDWKPTKDLPVRTSKNNFVEWGSAADVAGPDLWNLSAYVVNLDPKGARNIDWDAAMMRVEGLKPQHVAFICSPGAQGRSDREGPLYFARDRSSIPTTVYFGLRTAAREQGTVASGPLKLVTQFILQPEGADSSKGPAISVRVSTELVRSEEGYRITYLVENLAAVDVMVELPIDPDTVKQMGEQRILLKKGETRKATVVSETFPAAIRFPARIMEIDNQGSSAIIAVPTFRSVPKRRPGA